MTEQQMKQREAISAMADGQLNGAELAQILDALRSDEAAVDAWYCYHLAGDVMRGGTSADPRRDTVFLQRLRVGLGQEVGARRPREPEVSSVERTAESLVALGERVKRPSSNDARFGWRAVAGLAVMAIAVTVGWVSAPGSRQAVEAPALAQLPALSARPTVVGGLAVTPVKQQVMMRDPKLDQWLAAHRQFGGASALQMPVGFVRNATFEGAAP